MRRVIIAVLVTLLAPGCDESAPSGEGAHELELGYSALRISLPVFVAHERGFFREQGLTIRLKRYETAQPLVEEVLDGRILAGGYAALPIVWTAASRDDSEVRLATAMVEDEDHPVSYLLRKAGRTELSTVADLRGRSVGILPTVAYRRWLEQVLSHAGVEPSEVTITPIAPPQQVAALDNRGVDALFTNDPMATLALATGVAEHLGPRAPVPRATGGPLLFGSFLVHPRLTRERPEDVRRLLAALDQAVAFIEGQQELARRLMPPYVRESERPFVDRYPPARYLPSAEVDDSMLSAEAQKELRLGVLDRPIDTSGWALSRGATP